MYERQGREGRGDGGGWQAGQQLGEEAQRIGEHITRERAHSEAIAQQLGRESMMQWSKAVTGLLALPTAVALGAASWALYLAAFVERGFEIFQQQAMEM